MRPKRPSESSARPAEAKPWKESALKRIFGDRPFIADDRKSGRMKVADVKCFKELVIKMANSERCSLTKC
jgi:hypothetical protein